jgi:hypothetical protein
MDGLDRNAGFSKQPITTVADAMNVRCRDVWESRTRLGSRPGLVKAFAQNVAGTVQSFSFSVAATEDAYMSRVCYNVNSHLLDGGNISVGAVTAFILTVEDGYCNSGNILGIQQTALRGIFHFDMSTVPIGATILQATLKLQTLGHNGPGGEAAWCRRLTSTDWVENEVTWNQKSTMSAWASPGGDYTTSQEVSWTKPTTNSLKFITGLAALTQTAFDVQSRQIHLLLMADVENYDPPADLRSRFASRTAGSPWPPPTLQGNYEVLV